MKPSVDGMEKSTKTLKRRHAIGFPDFEEHAVPPRKIRLMGKDSSSKRSLVLHPSPVSEKVDAFVSQQQVLGRKDMHASFHDRTTNCTRMDVAGENNRLNMGTSLTIDTDSCRSSVEDYSSDAESHCRREYVEEACSFSPNVELRTDIHRSELHAYRSALWALYTSGPLSWEEEENLTNLQRLIANAGGMRTFSPKGMKMRMGISFPPLAVDHYRTSAVFPTKGTLDPCCWYDFCFSYFQFFISPWQQANPK
ncbi:hypothetical protein SLEP1_g43866 [Rubroshorea leprosula]|uniref:Uncharacterized protein n=1 Tax=Rubroshorea leprosula TaxID=152421 RepID=A0AAV5LEC8_9ROSI|nr:hypothetical protein SLEP1_g43866 [Rubroshorea leprosula]